MSGNPFRIQYVSDLHLEFEIDNINFEDLVCPCAPYLALAGDIGKPNHKLLDAFLRYCSHNWSRVFYVAGNHEYYSNRYLFGDDELDDIKSTETMNAKHMELIQMVQKYHNIHFFTEDSPSVFLNDEQIALVGATLWTEIPISKQKLARKAINDYNFIAIRTQECKQRRITPQDIHVMHQRQRAILEREILFWHKRDIPICVITHHLPSFELIAECYSKNPINFCFASVCDALIASPVKAWIYGHSHACGKRVINGVTCAINARGYPHENIHGFGTKEFIEIVDVNKSSLRQNAEMPNPPQGSDQSDST